MKPSETLSMHRDAVRAIVEAHHACNAHVFGSVARGTDGAGSDLDLLIDATVHTSLFDLGAIQAELQELLETPVEVVTSRALPAAFRDAILQDAIAV
jgi:predicted nucleotidyltransferase